MSGLIVTKVVFSGPANSTGDISEGEDIAKERYFVGYDRELDSHDLFQVF